MLSSTEIHILLRKRIKSAGFIALSIVSALVMIVGGIKVGLAGILLPLFLFLGLAVAVLLIRQPSIMLFGAVGYSALIGPTLMGVKGIPVGILMDGALLVTALGFFLPKFKAGDLSFFKIPGAILVLLWIGYHLFQVANPAAASRVAWFYVMRPAVAYPLLFFLTYSVLQTEKQLKHLLYFLLGMYVFSALWGVYQQMFGYFPFEMSFLQAADAIHLVYIQGRWRIFGTLTSPAQYGVVMAMFGMVMLFLTISLKRYKWLFGILTIVFFFVVIHSGTRTAYVIPPIALFSYILIERKTKWMITGAVLAVFFLVLMIIPTNNYQLQRIQSTFKTEEDASFQVRADNRARIYPYIISHPIGGGLGSTGVWGMRFSPYTMLAQFAPDSGYIRVSVELGWIGLLLYLTLLAIFFFLMIKAVLTLDGWKRTLGVALIASLSSLILVEWAQDIVGKIPMNVLIWIILAVVLKLPQLRSESTNS